MKTDSLSMLITRRHMIALVGASVAAITPAFGHTPKSLDGLTSDPRPPESQHSKKFVISF